MKRIPLIVAALFLITSFAIAGPPAMPPSSGGSGVNTTYDADSDSKVDADKVDITTSPMTNGQLTCFNTTSGKFESCGAKTTYTEPSTLVPICRTGAATTGACTYAPVIDDPDNFAANFTGMNLYGGTFIANAAGTAALPDPAVDMHFTIVLEGANANVIEPLSSGTDDTIVLNGTALTQGHNITSSTSGAMCVFQYRAANSWMATCNGFVDGT